MTTTANKSAIVAKIAEARALVAALPVDGATEPPPPPPPPPPPIESATFVQITDAPTGMTGLDGNDGPTWIYANKALLAKWRNLGGDWRDSDNVAQGPKPFAQGARTNAGDLALDVKDLAAKLLARNVGIMLRFLAGNGHLAAINDTTKAPSRLHIVTDQGAFDPPCIADTWIAPSAGGCMGGQPTMMAPALLRFDLSGVSGTVQSATLTLNVTHTYGVPLTVGAFLLDPPALRVPSVTDADAAQGIAATVAKDNDLAQHPSVLIYDDLVSPAYIGANFDGIAGKTADMPAGCPATTIDWPQYGLKALRCWRDPPSQRLISWHHWAEPKSNPPKPWQRDFGNGHEHLFVRYLIEIGTDLKDVMTEAGMKLPGFGGTYNWGNTPSIPNDGTWEARLWHTGVSKAHPHIYSGMVYLYAAEHPLSQTSGQGNSDPRNEFNAYLKAGQVLCLEQEVKLNTITNGAADPNGILRVWLNGVLVMERTDVAFRKYDQARIQDLPFVNIYHGGMGIPTAPFHYDIGGLVVATEYIGPPKVLNGAPPQPPPQPTIDSFTATPETIIAGSSSLLAWQTSNAPFGAVTLNDGPVSVDGSLTVSPQATTTFTLKAGDGVMRSVSVAVTVPVPPDPTLPSWVPPPGSFAEFTLNTPGDVGAPRSTLANWCGGAFIRDFGRRGAVAYHGGGEHSPWPDRGGVLVLDCDSRQYVMRCVPAIETHIGVSSPGRGSPTNKWGAYADDDYPQLKHTYNCLSEMPASWGGGQHGSLVRVAHTGGLLLVPDGTRTHGYSSTYRFDLSRAVDGHSRLTGMQTYDFGSGKPASVNDAANAGMDWLREGWWCYSRIGTNADGQRWVFTHKSGRVDPPTFPAIGLAWGTIHHFADDDSLVVFARDDASYIRHAASATEAWTRITFAVNAADQQAWTFNPNNIRFVDKGYVGFKWSTLLNCFVGFDFSYSAQTAYLWKIIPPDTAAKRFIDAWHVEREALASADGSGFSWLTDAGQQNGAFGRLVECPALRAFVWTRDPRFKGQLLRARGM